MKKTGKKIGQRKKKSGTEMTYGIRIKDLSIKYFGDIIPKEKIKNE